MENKFYISKNGLPIMSNSSIKNIAKTLNLKEKDIKEITEKEYDKYMKKYMEEQEKKDNL